MPEALEAALVLAMMLGATLKDLRTRRVPNAYWVPFIAFAVVLWTGRLVRLEPRDLLLPALVALVLTGLFYGLWYLYAFGGADAKGLMVVAWLWPGAPDLLGARLAPAFDILVNGSFLMILVPVFLFLSNVLRGRFQGAATFLAVPMDVQEAERRHVWPMQRVEDGTLRWRYWQRPAEPLGAVYQALRQHGVRQVWATPKVPFMLYLTGGLVVERLMGNAALRAAAWALPA